LAEQTFEEEAPREFEGPLPWAEIAATAVPIIMSVPAAAVGAVAAALSVTIRGAAARPDDEGAWCRLFAFAKVVLATPPRGRRTADVLHSRCSAWVRAGPSRWPALWADTRAKFSGRARPTSEGRPVEDIRAGAGGESFTAFSPEDLPDAAARRAEGLAEDGLYAKALAALSAAKVAADTPETRSALSALHPRGPLPNIPPQPADADISFSPGFVRTALRGFKLGSGAGLSGLTPRHVWQAFAVPGSGVPGALAELCRHIVLGRVPLGARPFFFGARLLALEKRAGGIRPIASGDVFRRLAGSLLSPLSAGRPLKQRLLRTKSVSAPRPAPTVSSRPSVATLPAGPRVPRTWL
jgi:hypothetical protein